MGNSATSAPGIMREQLVATYDNAEQVVIALQRLIYTGHRLHDEYNQELEAINDPWDAGNYSGFVDGLEDLVLGLEIAFGRLTDHSWDVDATLQSVARQDLGIKLAELGGKWNQSYLELATNAALSVMLSIDNSHHQEFGDDPANARDSALALAEKLGAGEQIGDLTGFNDWKNNLEQLKVLLQRERDESAARLPLSLPGEATPEAAPQGEQDSGTGTEEPDPREASIQNRRGRPRADWALRGWFLVAIEVLKDTHGDAAVERALRMTDCTGNLLFTKLIDEDFVNEKGKRKHERKSDKEILATIRDWRRDLSIRAE